MFFDDLEKRKQEGIYRERLLIETAQGAVVKVNNQDFINFCSNDYLGFANDPELKQHFIKAVDRYGIGSGSSQLLTGYSLPHYELEKKLARFLKRESALVFSTGYQANLAIASTLSNSSTILIQDKFNHASLIDAGLLSKGKLLRYAHNNVQQLESFLKKNKGKSLMVITDGVFSMDGDHAFLKEIVFLCKKFNALLLVDDAHGIGVLGENGAGLLEEMSLTEQDVPLLTGTFGKSFGACGAFVSGPKVLIESFVQKARTYIYTTALMPAVASTMSVAIDRIIRSKKTRAQLKKLIAYYVEKIQTTQYEVKTQCHIQSLLVGESTTALDLSRHLFEKRILARAIRPPTVPKGTARLRISITAKHTKDYIDQLIKALGGQI